MKCITAVYKISLRQRYQAGENERGRERGRVGKREQEGEYKHKVMR
jgi:hypothetical protein